MPDTALADTSGAGGAGGPAGAGAAAVPGGATAVTAPFAAGVWQVHARPGMQVFKGDKLLSLEAMKMETILTAPHDGIVVGVYAGGGTQVEAGQPLAAIEPAPAGRSAREAPVAGVAS